MKKYLYLVLGLVISLTTIAQNLQEVTSFGTNLGNLKMYKYVPINLQASSPIVVAIHGCTQSAEDYARTTEWNDIADRYGFIVIYPEQQYLNNYNYCFNWFYTTDQERGVGEAASIFQMVENIKSNYTIDTTQIFVTGLSAGAAMSNVMLACYPDVFSAGAVMAGTPYKSGTDLTTGLSAMNGYVDKTAEEWKNLVLNQNPSYAGNFPKVSVFHGLSDNTVKPQNINEIVEQWTSVNNTDAIADITNSNFFGNSYTEQSIYLNEEDTIMAVYKFTSMGHGISVDTGSCNYQGGNAEIYSYNMGIHSTYWAARFFGLIPAISITGNSFVTENETNLTYSTSGISGSTYDWTFPSGVTIVSGQGTENVIVDWGNTSGYVEVRETDSDGCTNPPVYKKITISTSINKIPNNKLDIFYNNSENNFLLSSDFSGETYYKITSIDGRELYSGVFIKNENIQLIQTRGFVIVSLYTGNEILNKRFKL